METCSLKVLPSQLPLPEGDRLADEPGDAVAVLGGGCFWCVEAVYREMDGVSSVVSGYAGGTAETANYEAVCSGTTDHAEVIEIQFDLSRTTFGEILRIFFSIAHDPTQLDRQGADVGRQYRSAIFYADEEQKRFAEAYIEQLEDSGVFDAPIVTTLEPLTEFYEAEAYHQDYARRNPNQPYIAYNALPKLSKLRSQFSEKLARD